MKLLIAGSRSYANQLITVCSLLDDLVQRVSCRYDFLGNILPNPPTEIISGCAMGIDHAAIVWAGNHKIPCRKMPADWKQFGIGAGFKRNEEMAKIADYGIIIWDGKSKGTQHMMDMLSKYDKEYLLWDKLPVRKLKKKSAST